MQIRQWVDTTAPALIMWPSGASVGFAELEARANRLAHHFRAAGLANGDTVAIIMENNEHVHAVMWAARRCGLYYTMLNTHLTAAEAAYIVDNSGAKAVIGSRATRAICDALAAHLPAGVPGLLLTADDDSPASGRDPQPGWQRYPECVAAHPATPIADEWEGDLLQYSSGTTGRPKGIRRELPGLPPAEAPGLMTRLFKALGIDHDAVYLSPAPLYHTAPSVWSMSVQEMGGTVVVLEKFDAAGALEAIERCRVTHAQFVPTMFVRMLKLPAEMRNGCDLSSLRRVVHAAAPCPPEIKRQMIDWWGPIIDEYYGSSEGIGASYIRSDEWLEHPGSVGKPMMGVPHIIGVDGEELPAGEPGEIYFEGGLPFSYVGDAGKTAAARNAQGWATVGDIGYLDADGYLYLTDRRHHMIISGGVNIYPQEVENLLITHPRVLDAAVFGLPDPVMGQSVKAVVQLVNPADAGSALADELMAWLRDRLAHYKCPKSLSFEERLPRSDTGKLYKDQLAGRYSADQPSASTSPVNSVQ